MVARSPSRSSAKRPVLYQLCRAGEIFEVGDGPTALGAGTLLIGRGDPRRTDGGDGRVLVDDPWMSGSHARITPLERPPSRVGTHSGSSLRPPGIPSRFVVEDMGSTNGVLVNGVPSKKAPLLHGDLVETGRTFWIYVEESAMDPILAEPFELGGVSTWTPSFARQLADLLPRVTSSDHVLLVGAEGTGKGFLARTIHVVSGRTGRFVHLDCRDRKSKRLLVDLFGDENRNGRLRDAESGTLFIENLDALPLDVQDRLAEVLRRARAGSRSGLAARVVASMSPGVDDALALGVVQPSLVDVLGVVQVRMPSLSQRLPDLGLLLDDFLARARGAPAISRDACRAVLKYPFRAHVRAMGRCIEAAATLASVGDAKAPGGHAGSIEVVHLPVDVVGPELLRELVLGAAPAVGPDNTSEQMALSTGSESIPDVFADDLTDPTQRRGRQPTPAHGVSRGEPRSDEGQVDVDVESISAALRAAHGNVSAAARALGRPRAVLLRWIRELGIDPVKLR